ncbi:beta-ketoacyl synthase [Hahella sp. SMD15-11]|uniref:Beta-ketoacyl synthase n=1 Tax=Thermohahella caldifontis TaxID=3142973 RepID=A0AB39UVK4_9GAMM
MKTPLPCIVAMGGINAGGRTSFHHAYLRTVWDALNPDQRADVLRGLATLRGPDVTTDKAGERALLEGTLIRRITHPHYDPDNLPMCRNVDLPASVEAPLTFTLPRRELPAAIPEHWQVEMQEDGQARITVTRPKQVRITVSRQSDVKSAGQLPEGFDPARYYNARFQPRGTQMALFAASDALHQMGIAWDRILAHVAPDQIGVYGGTGFPPTQAEGMGGTMQAWLKGERVSSKSLAMGINSMPADFINAYVLGNVGESSCAIAACATFLYNLRDAVHAIQAGRVRVAMVINAEAPITPEIVEGFNAMGALATQERLNKLDGTENSDPRHSSRPFGENCGFTLGESAQAIVLMDDALALELGAQILGAVPDVYTHADGFKRSISGPGVGNYLTFARAAQLVRDMLGDEVLRNRTFIMAHGSGTPQNRVTESRIFHRVAEHFGVEKWPLAAVKAFYGHSISVASGDQMASALGVFEHGLLPGIPTIDKVADDVFADHLDIRTGTRTLEQAGDSVALLNSKGFGGANATAPVLGPGLTRALLRQRHGEAALAAWASRHEVVATASAAYRERAQAGEYEVIYRFGETVLDDEQVTLDGEGIGLEGYPQAVSLKVPNPYGKLKTEG